MTRPEHPAVRRRILRAAAVTVGILVAGVLAPAADVGALPATATPSIDLVRVVRTSPFAGSHRSVLDNEGSAYVPRDRAMWVADDDGKKLFEINIRTGHIMRTFDHDDLAGVRKKGGRHRAGQHRVGDLEAVAYDRRKDQLFVFSGGSAASAKPTAFRLDRSRGKLRLDSYQSLPSGSDFTGAAWNPRNKKLYVGLNGTIWSYRYKRGTVGSPIAIPGLTGVMGMTFTRDGGLLVARSPATVSLIDWKSRTFVPGWTFDLTPWGVLDARAVELVKGRLWVSDGYDLRAEGDPMDHGLFVFELH